MPTLTPAYIGQVIDMFEEYLVVKYSGSMTKTCTQATAMYLVWLVENGYRVASEAAWTEETRSRFVDTAPYCVDPAPTTDARRKSKATVHARAASITLKRLSILIRTGNIRNIDPAFVWPRKDYIVERMRGMKHVSVRKRLAKLMVERFGVQPHELPASVVDKEHTCAALAGVPVSMDDPSADDLDLGSFINGSIEAEADGSDLDLASFVPQLSPRRTT